MSDHAHHWLLPTPDGRSWLPARCRICGAERLMRAAMDDDIIRPAPHGLLVLQQSASSRVEARQQVEQELGEPVWLLSEAADQLGILPKRLREISQGLGHWHRGWRWLTRAEIAELERRAREHGLYDRPVRRRVSLRWS